MGSAALAVWQLRTQVMDYETPTLVDDESEVHPLLYKVLPTDRPTYPPTHLPTYLAT